LKSARLGYDGKGQRSVRDRDELSRAWRELDAVGQLPTLRVMTGKKTAKPENKPNDPFGVNRAVLCIS
jgi:hypothetical protein